MAGGKPVIGDIVVPGDGAPVLSDVGESAIGIESWSVSAAATAVGGSEGWSLLTNKKVGGGTGVVGGRAEGRRMFGFTVDGTSGREGKNTDGDADGFGVGERDVGGGTGGGDGIFSGGGSFWRCARVRRLKEIGIDC